MIVGDDAVVELFIKQYPTTKTQKNKDGHTALELAQKLNFQFIVHLIKTGQRAAVDSQAKTTSDTIYDEKVLIEAVQYSRMEIIRQFIEQRYQSKDEKKRICDNMIRVARRGNHNEVLRLLTNYYKSEWNNENASNQIDGQNGVSSNFKDLTAMHGSLRLLNSIITGREVLLDPAHLNTYIEYYSALISNNEKQAQELASVKDLNDLRQLVEQSRLEAKKRLDVIEERLEGLDEKIDDVEERIKDIDKRLFSDEKLTALLRKDLLEQKAQLEKDRNTIQCGMQLAKKEEKVAMKRQDILEFFKKHPVLLDFYRIIEQRLQSLFIRYYSDQGAFVKATTDVSKIIPIGE